MPEPKPLTDERVAKLKEALEWAPAKLTSSLSFSYPHPITGQYYTLPGTVRLDELVMTIAERDRQIAELKAEKLSLLARMAAARQAVMTDEDRQRTIDLIVEDSKNAND
jgi:hypothetical protein